MALELGLRSGTGKQCLLIAGTLGFWAQMLTLAGIIAKGAQVLKHRCDPKVSVDAESVLKELPRAPILNPYSDFDL